MPFCGKCGTETGEGVSFCGKCGAPISSGSGEASPPVPPPPPAPGNSMTSNVAGLLTYILGFITGIIFLILEPYKNDTFVRFHAFQSIFFSAALIVFQILWNGIFWSIFARVGFLWPIMSLISTLVSLGFFLFWVFLMYKAYNNERFMIPIIGEFAAKQAG